LKKLVLNSSSDASYACDAYAVGIDGQIFQLIDEKDWNDVDTTQPFVL
jgi:hypothetical protein